MTGKHLVAVVLLACVLGVSAVYVWQGWQTGQTGEIASPKPTQEPTTQSSVENYSIGISPTTDKRDYTFGENVSIAVEFKNLENENLTTTYNVAVVLHAEKYRGISVPLSVWDNYILRDNGVITIPAGGSVNLSYTLSPTDYGTNGNCVVKGWINENCMGFEEFTIHSGLKVSTSAPSSINPNENFNVSLSIKNTLGNPVENVSVDVYFSPDAVVSGTTSFEIPVLSPNESSTTLWVVSTSDPWGPLNITFKVFTKNTFDYSYLSIDVLHPIELDVIDNFVVHDKLGETLETGFKIKNIGDLDAENVLVELTLPENVTATRTTWNLNNLPGGGEAVFRTDLTFTAKGVYFIRISVSDNAEHTATGVIRVDVV
jgi:uncharacterized repeat protein (TIGR01451 family)